MVGWLYKKNINKAIEDEQINKSDEQIEYLGIKLKQYVHEGIRSTFALGLYHDDQTIKPAITHTMEVDYKWNHLGSPFDRLYKIKYELDMVQFNEHLKRNHYLKILMRR